jgi:hypothetical protein
MGFSVPPGDPYDSAMARARAARAAMDRAAADLATTPNNRRATDIDDVLRRLSDEVSP